MPTEPILVEEDGDCDRMPAVKRAKTGKDVERALGQSSLEVPRQSVSYFQLVTIFSFTFQRPKLGYQHVLGIYFSDTCVWGANSYRLESVVAGIILVVPLPWCRNLVTTISRNLRFQSKHGLLMAFRIRAPNHIR